jgi:hypothetical protein
MSSPDEDSPLKKQLMLKIADQVDPNVKILD